MYERFDKQAQQVIQMAGEIAAKKARKRGEGDIPRVRITLAEAREALDLVAPKHGYKGQPTAALNARLQRLRATTGAITVTDLREALKR